MTSLHQSSLENQLLAEMPAEAFNAIASHLQRFDLPLKFMLAEANAPVSYIYFPLHGIASITLKATNERRLEVGLFGREGMSSCSVLLGVDQAPSDTFIQVEGSALRIAARDFDDALRSCPPLSAFLLRFVQVAAVQTAYTAMSNGAFKIEERTARWLLMCHDRIAGDALPITHEFLGIMLGVRRSGVTDAIHVLEGRGFLRPRRGLIEIVDRAGLELIAGDSYGGPEAEYERLIGPLRRPATV
jgi:CRP-like cAMP-binding protein